MAIVGKQCVLVFMYREVTGRKEINLDGQGRQTVCASVDNDRNDRQRSWLSGIQITGATSEASNSVQKLVANNVLSQVRPRAR